LRIGGMRPRRRVVAGPLIILEQQGEFNVGGADCGVGVGKFGDSAECNRSMDWWIGMDA
jgi:hypothetical protein